jgi:hypothetical protein
MRVLLTTYESREDAESMVGLAAQFDTVAAAAEASDALVAGSMMPAMPAGGWL